MALKFTHDTEKKIVDITVNGYFDFSLNTEFKKIYDLDRSQIKQIQVNLQHVEYLDSSALGMLLLLRDMVGGAKDKISLVGARIEVKRVLNIANFNHLFIIL
ncbi:MAG: STAS domain-containing protein [Methylococcales bacterium]|nr:STAS domain-containing protein [Methylococcales bacterium]